MKDCLFWRTIAVAAVLSVAYVGHGLHGPMPSLSATAEAQGVATAVHDNTGYSYVVSSPDGKKVHYFGPKRALLSFNSEAYLGTLTAP